MESKNVLNSEDKVFGFFNGFDVSFKIGDCARKEFCIKIMNLKTIGEEQHDEVPNTTCIGDSRLTLINISKSDIREYFKNGTTETTPPKAQKTTSAKDFRRASHSISH